MLHYTVHYTVMHFKGMVHIIHNAPLYTVFLCVQSTGRNIFFKLIFLVMKTPLFPLKYKVQGPAEAPGGSRQGARRVQQWCPAGPGMVPGESRYGARRVQAGCPAIPASLWSSLRKGIHPGAQALALALALALAWALARAQALAQALAQGY